MFSFFQKKHYYQALAVLIGQIIGVGIFGLPFLTYKAGVLSLLFFIILIGFIQYLLHLIYANLLVVTKELHRLPGLAEIYLGKTGKNIVFFANMIGGYSGLLAYTIVTGVFLNQLLSPIFGGSEFVYATIVFAVEAIIILLGINILARAELFMTGALLLVVVLIIARSFNVVAPANFNVISWPYFFLPYGAMIFALDGTGALPVVAELIKRDKKMFKKIIRQGIFISSLITALFAMVVVGITGANTTPDALLGVKSVIGDGVITLALVFGVLCLMTSFLGTAQAIRDIYNWDYGVNKYLAWFFAISIPYFLYLGGIIDLISVISFAGAVAGGLGSVMLILTFYHLKKRKQAVLFERKINPIVLYLLIAMFISGIVFEIYYFISR